MSWDLRGNAGTQPTKDFLGTTDDKPIVFRTNGTVRVRVSSNGLEAQEARTYLLGVDGAGNHWIMAGGTAEPQDNALGFNRAAGAVVVNGGWNAQFNGNRTYLLGVDGAGIHWVMAGGIAEPQDNALGFNRAANAIIVNNGWDMQFAGADCAENFESADGEGIEPGSVVVAACDGKMQPCTEAYDKRVAGVVSGAEGLAAGLILNRSDSETRVPIALIGKVYCNVDANLAPVGVGDLLTTSPTVGYAMKAEDSQRMLGTTLGKALQPLDAGRSRIPVLVALQ